VIDIGLPEETSRPKILRINNKMKLAPENDLVNLAKNSHGYVGSDLQ